MTKEIPQDEDKPIYDHLEHTLNELDHAEMFRRLSAAMNGWDDEQPKYSMVPCVFCREQMAKVDYFSDMRIHKKCWGKVAYLGGENLLEYFRENELDQAQAEYTKLYCVARNHMIDEWQFSRDPGTNLPLRNCRPCLNLKEREEQRAKLIEEEQEMLQNITDPDVKHKRRLALVELEKETRKHDEEHWFRLANYKANQ